MKTWAVDEKYYKVGVFIGKWIAILSSPIWAPIILFWSFRNEGFHPRADWGTTYDVALCLSAFSIGFFINLLLLS